MIELDNRTSLEINDKLLNEITQTLTDKEIELIITTQEEIQHINYQHRNINKATDVLSFPYVDMPIAGSIVISAWHVLDKSIELGHTNEDELCLLYIHGLLHLLGYNHEIDDGEMRQEEERLITKFNLPKSLIIRTQG